MTKGLDARLANRPFFGFWFSDTLELNPERQSDRKSKTKNGRLASLASNPQIGVAILGTLS